MPELTGPQMYEVVEMATSVLPEAPPRHLLGIGDIDDLVRGTELGIDTFDCAMPTRLGRHGVALVPEPDRRWRVGLPSPSGIRPASVELPPTAERFPRPFRLTVVRRPGSLIPEYRLSSDPDRVD